nr:transposase (putative), gypsy type [Tanacetum cinerariifolium]
MGRDTIQLENVVSTISQEYLLEFTSEYGRPEGLHLEFPGPEETIVDFRKANNRRSQNMDLFNLISATNPTKVKTWTRPRAAHEVPLLTVTASRVIDMEDVAAASESSGTPTTIKKSPLDFANEDQPQTVTEGISSSYFLSWISYDHCCDGNDNPYTNTPPKVSMRDYDAFRPAQSTHGGKSLASMGFDAGSLLSTPVAQDPSCATKSVSDPELLSSKGPATEILTEDAAIVQGWGVTNDSRLEAPDACRYIVDHIVPPGLRFEQEVRLLKKARSKIARRDQRIQAKVDMKKSAEAKNAELAKELYSLRVQSRTSKLVTSSLSDQVLNLQAQVMGEEKIKVAFKEFKKYEDDKVEQWCAKMDARLDKLSVDFDEELYPHILTAIAGRLAKGMIEGLKYGIEHDKAGRDLADVEAYDPESNNKFLKALQELKDLKYPMIDQLEKLKDAPMELIMASLYLESDTGEDAPQWIRDLRPSSSQLKIFVYPEARDPEDLWAVKEEMILEDAIAANISRAEKKKKCRVVCRTHKNGSAHHARSDGISVFAPTVPQGLAILLADAATQTEAADQEEPHPKL